MLAIRVDELCDEREDGNDVFEASRAMAIAHSSPHVRKRVVVSTDGRLGPANLLGIEGDENWTPTEPRVTGGFLQHLSLADKRGGAVLLLSQIKARQQRRPKRCNGETKTTNWVIVQPISSLMARRGVGRVSQDGGKVPARSTSDGRAVLQFETPDWVWPNSRLLDATRQRPKDVNKEMLQKRTRKAQSNERTIVSHTRHAIQTKGATPHQPEKWHEYVNMMTGEKNVCRRLRLCVLADLAEDDVRSRMGKDPLSGSSLRLDFVCVCEWQAQRVSQSVK